MNNAGYISWHFQWIFLVMPYILSFFKLRCNLHTVKYNFTLSKIHLLKVYSSASSDKHNQSCFSTSSSTRVCFHYSRPHGCEVVSHVYFYLFIIIFKDFSFSFSRNSLADPQNVKHRVIT